MRNVQAYGFTWLCLHINYILYVITCVCIYFLDLCWVNNFSPHCQCLVGDTYDLMEPKPKCRIAHILGILLMISYWFCFYFSNIIVVCTLSFNMLLQNQKLDKYSLLVTTIFGNKFYLKCM